MRRLLRTVCVCLAIGAAVPADALTVRALSVEELLAGAERIVHARCLAVSTVRDRPNLVVSEITLAVEETLKGPAADRVVVRQLGGPWRRLVPTCAAGDEVVLFLHAPSRAGLTSPVGLGQGYLRVVRPPGEAAALVGDARIVGALGAPAGTSRARAAAGAAATTRLDAALDALRARLGSPR